MLHKRIGVALNVNHEIMSFSHKHQAVFVYLFEGRSDEVAKIPVEIGPDVIAVGFRHQGDVFLRCYQPRPCHLSEHTFLVIFFLYTTSHFLFQRLVIQQLEGDVLCDSPAHIVDTLLFEVI